MPWIDAHCHLPLEANTALSDLGRWPVDRLVNICVDSDELGGLDPQRQWYQALANAHPDRFAWVTSFRSEGFADPGWADRTIRQLAADYAAGACGCKVWKNLGMHLRDPGNGRFVFVDDPRFHPVFEWLEGQGRPLLMHIAEPIAAWLPLDPQNPHFGYYRSAPQWHWHGRSDVPSHQRLIDSRDAIIERYTRLPVVGMHLGSQEHDLAAVAARLSRHANYHVDTAGRLGDLLVHARQDHAGLCRFLTEHSERTLWGVDWVLTSPVSGLSPEQRQRLHDSLLARYSDEQRFFTETDPQPFWGTTAQPLGMSGEILHRLTYANARAMYFPRG